MLGDRPGARPRPPSRSWSPRAGSTCSSGTELHVATRRHALPDAADGPSDGRELLLRRATRYAHDGPVTGASWRDTTTLFVHRAATGRDESGPVLATGNHPQNRTADFLRQLRTMRVLNATSELGPAAEAGRVRRLLRRGAVPGLRRGVRQAGPVSTRPRRRGRRASSGCRLPRGAGSGADDGVELLLTSVHRAGDLGLCLVAHGLGVSSKIFTIDTIETYLGRSTCSPRGFDVWLLDFRASIDLPAFGDAVHRRRHSAPRLPGGRRRHLRCHRRRLGAGDFAPLRVDDVHHGHAVRAAGCPLRRVLAGLGAHGRARVYPAEVGAARARPAVNCSASRP